MERRRPRKRALPDLTGGYRLPGFVSLTLGRGKFPISVWLGAKGTRVQFTRPSIAAPQVVPGTDNLCFEVSSLVFMHCTIRLSAAGKWSILLIFSVRRAPWHQLLRNGIQRAHARQARLRVRGGHPGARTQPTHVHANGSIRPHRGHDVTMHACQKHKGGATRNRPLKVAFLDEIATRKSATT
jgi:hypothetical protein